MIELWKKAPWLLVFAAAVLLSLAIFGPALRGEFIMDDWGYISQNRWLTGAPGPLRFWTSLYQTDYWPLSYTLYWALWKVFGTDSLAYHLVNLILHAVNACLVFQAMKKRSTAAACLAALIFVIHPQQVQAVAWIFQLKTLLATALALAALLLFQKGKRALALAFFCSALLAKSSVVMLPVFLLCDEWLRLRQTRQRPAWGWLAAFFAVSLVAGIITLYVDRQHVGTLTQQAQAWDPSARPGFMANNLGFYLQHFFWPKGLAFLQLETTTDIWTVPWAATLVLVFFCLSLVLFMKRTTPPLWSSLWLCLAFYLCNLFPALGLVQVPAMKLAPVANHWAYLANMGLASACGLLLDAVDRRWPSRGRPLVLVGAGLLAVFLMQSSGRQAATYASETAVWSDVVARYPDAAVGFYNLGTALNKTGAEAQGAAAFAKAVQLDPEHARAHFNLAVHAITQQRWVDAEPLLRRTLLLDPALAQGYVNLAYVLWQTGRLDEAVSVLKLGLQKAPPQLDLYRNLCLYLEQMHLTEEARAVCPAARAMELDEAKPASGAQ